MNRDGQDTRDQFTLRLILYIPVKDAFLRVPVRNERTLNSKQADLDTLPSLCYTEAEKCPARPFYVRGDALNPAPPPNPIFTPVFRR